MAGPGGVSAGRASVRILPDTSSFGISLKRYLERIERTTRVQIKTDLDRSGIDRGIEETRRTQERDPIKVPTVPKMDDFGKRLRADLAKSVKSIEADIPITADGEKFRRQLETSIKFAEKSLQVDIPLDVEDAAKVRKKAQDSVREVQQMIQAEKKRLELPLKPKVEPIADDVNRAVKVAQATAPKVKIKTEVDRDSLRRAVSSLAPSLSGLTRGVRPVAILGLSTAVAGLAQRTLALAGALEPAVGALALLPAAAGAGAIGIGTLAIGLHGFGDALKAAFDPKKSDKFIASLKNIAPAARETILAVKGLQPAFTKLRMDVQQRLFAGLGGEVKTLGATYLPILRTGLGQTASAFNDLIRATSQSLLRPETVRETQTSLANVGAAMQRLMPIGPALTRSFSTLTAVGSKFLPGLASGAANAAERFQALVENAAKTGQLKDFMQGGIAALKQLGSIAKNAATSVLGIVKAAQQAGGGTLGGLNDALQGLSDFVNSPVGQGALRAVFQGASDGLAALGKAFGPVKDALVALAPVFGEVFRQAGAVLGAAIASLADAFKTLAPSILPIVTTIGQGLVAAVKALNPLLQALAGFLAQNKPLLLAVGVAILALTSPISATVLAIGGLVAVFARFGPQITTALQPLVDGLKGYAASIVSTFQTIMPALQALWAAIGPVLLDLGKQLISVIGPALQQTATVISTQVAPAFAALLTAIAPFAAVFLRTFGGVVIAVIKTLMAVFRGLLVVISGVVNVIAGLLTGDWSRIWQGARQIVSGAFTVIVAIIKGALGVIGAQLGAAWNSIRTVTSKAWSAIRTAISNVLKQITGAIREEIAADKAAIISGWNSVRSGTVSGFRAIYSAVASALGQITTAIRQEIAIWVSFFQGLGGKISAALGDLGHVLFAAGQRLIQGLVDGIKSMAGAPAAAVKGIAARIGGFFPGSPIKEGPLKSWNNGGAGKRLVAMLAEGMGDTSAVTAAMVKVAGAVAHPARELLRIGKATGKNFIDSLTGTSPSAVRDAITGLASQLRDAVRSYQKKSGDLAKKIDEDRKAVDEAEKNYASVVSKRGKLAGTAVRNAATRITDAQAKYNRDVKKKGISKDSLASDRRSIRKAQDSYKETVERQADITKSAVGNARKRITKAVEKLGKDNKALVDLNESFGAIADDPAKVRRFTQVLAKYLKPLENLAARRAALTDRINEANQKLTAAIQLRDDYARSVADSARALGDLTKAQAQEGQALDASDIQTFLAGQLQAIRTFRKNIDALRTRGLSDAAIQQIIQAGVDGGEASAEAILAGGDQAIKAINKLTSDIAGDAATLGNKNAEAFYQSGVDAAQGILDGLVSQEDALAQTAKQLTDRLNTAIQETMGKQNPTIRQIGVSIGSELAAGMDESRAQVEKAAKRLALAVVSAPGLATSSVAGGGTVNQFNITTHNPVPERASDTTTRVARKLVLLGVAA